MANAKKPAVSFDEIIQQGRLKRRNEQLAQEIFGKNRRQSAPGVGNKKAPLGGSLASRVGVTKRTASVPRSNSATTRNARGPTKPPSTFSRSAAADTDDLSSIAVSDLTGNDFNRKSVIDTSNNISFKGAAGGPYVVVASNFAPGTTAADIESVMRGVGGDVQFCRLVAATPTVIAEMAFAEISGADKVISTFNNKRADGRLLHVYMKNGITSAPVAKRTVHAEIEPVEVAAPIAPTTTLPEDGMEVDDVSESREAENRLREERRGRNDVVRGDRDRREPVGRNSFPAAPRGGRGYAQDDYYRESRPEPGYGDRRYGYGGGNFGGRGRYGGGGYGRGGGGQSWRP